MPSLEDIEKDLGTTLSPHVAADYRVILAGYYSRFSGELQEVLATKPSRWMSIRKAVKTNRDADMEWDASELGLKELRLTMQMKRVDKIISSLSSFLRVAENEARNSGF